MGVSLQSLGYLPISTTTLSAATGVNFDLYIQRPTSGFAELYREKSYPLTDQDLVRLRESGVAQLYVRFEEADCYRQYLQDHVLQETGIPTPVRYRALRDLTRIAFEDAYRIGNCDSIVSVADTFGHDLAAMLGEAPPVFEELFKTLDHDYYTFTHACNVSTYCAVIAIRMELFDLIEVAEIAAGGLLHDIGKRHITRHVLNKNAKLTESEWNLMKQHPVTGFQELSQRVDLGHGQLMMVYQHHERLDGSGYPAGVTGNEIHLWAKICAVADVFDAMTCKRPYRRAMNIGEVYDHLRRLAGLRFDSEVVECWTAKKASTTDACGLR
jgi:HD-GYP domain-containing protein (c-di-GMP phosphodiesterase class II)